MGGDEAPYFDMVCAVATDCDGDVDGTLLVSCLHSVPDGETADSVDDLEMP